MTGVITIQTALRNHTTYLKKSFCTTPFKIADITEDKSNKTLQLMLMSSSPGILDGDEYDIKIELAEQCALQLETQSYQRLFTMQKGASQTMKVYMAEGSSFCFLPHPTVPHQASHFTAKNKIFLSNNCSLLWGEVLTCGRKLSGEVFCFTRYHNHTEIYRNNRLVIKENLLIQPALIDVAAIGQLEGYTHQATLIYLNEITAINDLTNTINEWLLMQDGITFGISTLHVNGLIVRLLGHKGEQLHYCLKMIAKHLPMEALNPALKEVTTTQPKAYAS